jgi:DNA-binding response OmpR family regulator
MAKILIVDDDRDLCSMLVDALSLNGHILQIAANGLEALDMIQRQVFDLALVDIWMPKLNGIELLEKLKDLAPGMPVVLITVHPTYETVVQALRGGACNYVEKPFTLGTLLETIHQALARHSPPMRIQADGLTIDLAAREVHTAHRQACLTPLEYDLLTYLLRHAHRVITADELLDKVWGYSAMEGAPVQVRNAVRRLRMKLGDELPTSRFITTVRGVGYRWVAEVRRMPANNGPHASQ